MFQFLYLLRPKTHPIHAKLAVQSNRKRKANKYNPQTANKSNEAKRRIRQGLTQCKWMHQEGPSK